MKDALFCGVDVFLLYQASSSPASSLRPHRGPYLLHPGVSIGAFALFALEFTLVSVAATMLIAMCPKLRSRTAGIFRAPVLRFFGKYSYGLYIFHFALLVFYVQYLKFMTQRSHSHAWGNVINSLTELTVAFVVSMLSYRWFEMPFLKLKRFFPASGSVQKPGGQRGPAATVLR